MYFLQALLFISVLSIHRIFALSDEVCRALLLLREPSTYILNDTHPTYLAMSSSWGCNESAGPVQCWWSLRKLSHECHSVGLSSAGGH